MINPKHPVTKSADAARPKQPTEKPAAASSKSAIPKRGKTKNTLANGMSLHSGQSIVPRDSIAGNALSVVICIMSFLACLTLGVVGLVNQTATGWQNDISREVTIQIRPFDEVEMNLAIDQATKLVKGFDGISKVTVMDDAATARLLEPWLGSGLSLEELPVPRLLTLTIADGASPDFGSMRAKLEAEVPGASLDDHRAWVDRLTSMAWTMVLIGIVLFVLMMAATILTVIFATRGAMAGNKDVVEVLHFVGADSNFIAGEFQNHFLKLGLQGAVAGGIAAIFVFVGLGFWTGSAEATPEGDQISALFGSFSLGWMGYVGIALLLAAIAAITALTSRWTVKKHVTNLHTYRRV